MHPNIFYLVPIAYWNFFAGLLDFHKSFSSVGDCLRQCSPRAPGLWQGEAGARSRTTAGFTARAKVRMPITRCMGE